MSASKPAWSEPSALTGDGSLLGRLWRFVRPQAYLLVLALLIIPAMAAVEIAQPLLLGLAIDTYITHHISSGLATVISIFIGLVILQSLFDYLHLYCLFLVGQRSMHLLRKTTYRHILSRRAAFFDTMPVGRLLALTNDVESINSVFSSGVVTIVGDVVRMAAVLAMMLYLDAELTLLIFVTIPLVFFLVSFVRKRLRNSHRKLRAQFAALNEHVQEHLSGLPVLQIFCREAIALARFDKINKSHFASYRKVIFGETSMYAGVQAVGIISAAVIAWYAGSSVGSGTLTIGLVIVFIEYIKKFFDPIVQFSAKYAVLQSALAGAERVLGLLATGEEDAPMRASAEKRRDAGTGAAIEFRDIHFRYRAGEPVLRGLNLHVEPGQKVAVVGATGSGKSTLIKLLARLYEADRGDIYYRGQNILDIDVSELRRQITVVNQDVFLFEGSVRDNVRIGNPEASNQEIDRALEQVGAIDVLRGHGADEDTLLTRRGENFSVGERQLVAFARALIRDPELLILDEATAHIDPTTEETIGRALDVLMEGRTTLVIAHRLSTIRDADKIVLLDRGIIVEEGTYEALVSKGGLFAKLETSFSRDQS